MKKRSKSATSDDYIPTDVLMLVLARLPAKPLFRFKRVTRLWCWLISDPRLPAMHQQHTDSRSPRLVTSVTGLSMPHLVLHTAEFEEGDIMGVGNIRAAPPCKRLPLYDSCSNIVNGLTCFNDGGGQGGDVELVLIHRQEYCTSTTLLEAVYVGI